MLKKETNVAINFILRKTTTIKPPNKINKSHDKSFNSRL